ncbi:Alpha/Beta hydrolase protein [Gloeopeniophorella convolvens]|nr:Alpha/Beta hydrolase protein [Gloeopeniophorella convolvens]
MGSSAKVRPVTDVLPEGAKLHWLGRRRYDRVMLFFHGGGFTIPAGDHHFRFLPAVQDALKGSVGEIGIAFLEYSMAPQAQFPIQLRQANAALTHLLEHGAHPSNIVLCGDSAGGNLALQAISHILHPLPNLPPPPALSRLWVAPR